MIIFSLFSDILTMILAFINYHQKTWPQLLTKMRSKVGREGELPMSTIEKHRFPSKVSHLFMRWPSGKTLATYLREPIRLICLHNVYIRENRAQQSFASTWQLLSGESWNNWCYECHTIPSSTSDWVGKSCDFCKFIRNLNCWQWDLDAQSWKGLGHGFVTLERPSV